MLWHTSVSMGQLPDERWCLPGRAEVNVSRTNASALGFWHIPPLNCTIQASQILKRWGSFLLQAIHTQKNRKGNLTPLTFSEKAKGPRNKSLFNSDSCYLPPARHPPLLSWELIRHLISVSHRNRIRNKNGQNIFTENGYFPKGCCSALSRIWDGPQG